MALDPKFEVIGKIPTTNNRPEVILGRGISNIGPWFMDENGTVGHNCLHVVLNNDEEPPWYGRIYDGYDPCKGLFRKFCMACGVTCPDEVTEFAKLQRFGQRYSKAAERKL